MYKVIKVIVWGMGIYLIGGILMFAVSCDRRCERIYIPEDYRGIFVVVHQHPLGQPRDYSGWCREYQIPSDGVLITKFKPNPGWIPNRNNIKLYLIDDENIKKREVKWLYPGSTSTKVDPQQVYFRFLGDVDHGSFLLNHKSYTFGIYAVDDGSKIKKYTGATPETKIVTYEATQKMLGKPSKLRQYSPE